MRRGARVAYPARLESACTARYRGFESHPLRPCSAPGKSPADHDHGALAAVARGLHRDRGRRGPAVAGERCRDEAMAGRVARLYTFPAIGDWSRYEVTDLTPGTIALIPAGTGHRGCDVFAHIITLPGFKPGNELYLDRAIRDGTAGTAPHNAALAAAEDGE